MNHTIIMLVVKKLSESSKTIDLLFAIKQLKDGCIVCGEL